MRSLQGRNTMTSQPIRDEVEDHLITPKNSALIIIDYQPTQVSSIVSMDHRTLAEMLAGIEELDRTTINAWEDEEFVTAVKVTGRKKLIMAALWTEACLTFP